MLRFTNEDVAQDVEAVAAAVAQSVSLDYEFKQRKGGVSSVMDRHRIANDRKARGTGVDPES